MPGVAPPSRVLVTGANGFIAIHIVRNLLERGFAVRGTVRSKAKARHLDQMFSSYGDKYEVVIVEDVTKEGAFDDAVKGVDAIEHTASPCQLESDHPDEVIVPAVSGTVSILQSALKHGPSVKRIVITSSCAAILEINPTPSTFSEADWGEQAINVVNAQGRDAPGLVKYRASKTLAEKAAWEFWNKHRDEVAWDLTVINPPWVFGPSIHDVTTPDTLNASTLTWYNYVVHPTSNGVTDETLATLGGCYVDVRDLAEAHSLVLEKPEAGGERIIVSAGTWKAQDFIDAANTINPPVRLSQPLPRGVFGAGSPNPATVHLLQFDNSKAGRILGIKYRTMAKTTEDTLRDYEARGW
ncbi:hypothetical protein SERLA73DRAFT_163798 [Serpula lacrymans var. lacrymans S7.3]|uniref:NAD-dependent epimerase/dehydratase domain-containing protein n=2 Tax=Serpula lacrymans var. lacrymans TaxID=341189 RepID=F8QFJ7_SERL3|nr:uncharacterized protein SERLADRAFT_479410 [Serpula lacrymans var. lacrymans S7.9]EGN92981.1 hypothetical protein SERLA73DRAFT_163798 [Serpula lacrymans var. lacrymans S7.3]EGO19693.1 hypothetical protein SERLADRAFT_479410 [Serpula lacrymans var. lacrymans S7.9]